MVSDWSHGPLKATFTQKGKKKNTHTKNKTTPPTTTKKPQPNTHTETNKKQPTVPFWHKKLNSLEKSRAVPVPKMVLL